MFREAFSIARNFTWPVVISHRTVSGRCAAGIGSLVIVNDEGWALTVGHIIEECFKLETSQAAVAKHDADLAAIKGNRSLRAKDRGKRIAALGRLPPSAIRNFSYWWGKSGVDFVDVTAIQGFDLALGRLVPFDPKTVANYPILKDPDKDVEPGESLCTLGFPFHTIEPAWDDTNQTFVLPPGAIPLPLFAIEGILARFIDVKPRGEQRKFPLRYLETSSPGLLGQSGGPIFDVHGTLWAIQSHTTSYPLRLRNNYETRTKTEREHLQNQFLHVGRGVHVETIVGLLEERGIKYAKSEY